MCPDERNTGHERAEAVLSTDPGGEPSVPTTPINLGIAAEFRSRDSDGRNRRSYEVCRIIPKQL